MEVTGGDDKWLGVNILIICAHRSPPPSRRSLAAPPLPRAGDIPSTPWWELQELQATQTDRGISDWTEAPAFCPRRKGIPSRLILQILVGAIALLAINLLFASL